jgi:hypothetical protein
VQEPAAAAAVWPNMSRLAAAHSLSLVGPCVSNAAGAAGWLNAFDAACQALSGGLCAFDYPCTHAYYFPAPCGGLPSWACASSMLPMVDRLSRRYGGKPVWIAEWGCPRWIGPVFSAAGLPPQYCDEARQLGLMAQLLPALDSSAAVFRYGWDLNRVTGFAWSDGPGSAVVLQVPSRPPA